MSSGTIGPSMAVICGPRMGSSATACASLEGSTLSGRIRFGTWGRCCDARHSWSATTNRAGAIGLSTRRRFPRSRPRLHSGVRSRVHPAIARSGPRRLPTCSPAAGRCQGAPKSRLPRAEKHSNLPAEDQSSRISLSQLRSLRGATLITFLRFQHTSNKGRRQSR